MTYFKKLDTTLSELSNTGYGRPFALQISTAEVLITTRLDMWRMINDSPTPHFYEIITTLYKIRLYMDMEFLISQNTDMDVMQLLTSIVVREPVWGRPCVG